MGCNNNFGGNYFWIIILIIIIFGWGGSGSGFGLANNGCCNNGCGCNGCCNNEGNGCCDPLHKQLRLWLRLLTVGILKKGWMQMRPALFLRL